MKKLFLKNLSLFNQRVSPLSTVFFFSSFFFLSSIALAQTTSLKPNKSTNKPSDRSGMALTALEAKVNSSYLITRENFNPKKRFSIDGSLKIGGRMVNETIDDSRLVLMQFDPNLIFRFTDNFYFKARLILDLRSARAQETFQGSENIGQNKLTGREYALIYSPFSFLEIRAGANGQGFLGSPFLIDEDVGFPGMLETFKYDFGNNVKIEFISQQSMPISYTGNGNRTEKELTPLFFTETLKVQTNWFKYFDVDLNTSYYHYSSLPSVVAQNSSNIGNTTTDGGAANSKFSYAFNGFLFDVKTCYCIRLIHFRTGFQFLKNISGPLGSSSAASKFYLKTRFYIWGKTTITPSIEYFSNGSDVAPAYYQSSFYGFANRKGVVLGLSAFFEKFGFKLSTQYVRSDLINTLGPQSAGRDEWRIQLQSKRIVF